MKKQESPVLEVCRVCAELRGDVTVDGVRRRQRCLCEPREPEWPRYDFNRKHELCHCCAAETIPSGSRWSLFFCEPCKTAIVHLRDQVGRVVIPIGRHTLMNGVGMSREGCVQTFVTQTTSLFDRMKRLHAWHADRVRDLLGEIDGGDGAVPLARYLELAKRRAEREPIDELVPRLAAHLDGGTP